MGLRLTYDYHRSLYDNVQSYAANPDLYWDEQDALVYSSLKITQGWVGPERKKWKFLLDHIRAKAIQARQK